MANYRVESGKLNASGGCVVGLGLKLGTNDGEVDLSALATDQPIGVTIEVNSQNDNIAYALPGQVVKGVASDAISRGAQVTVTTGGKFVTVGTSTNAWIWGVAMTGAGADGDVFKLMFWPSLGDHA